MKSLIIIFAIFACCSSFVPPLASPVKPDEFVATRVYICNSTTSACYHASKDCRGLNRCTHEITATTMDSAKNYYDKRACKICE